MKKQNPLFACSFMGWLAQQGGRAWKWDQVVIVKGIVKVVTYMRWQREVVVHDITMEEDTWEYDPYIHNNSNNE